MADMQRSPQPGPVRRAVLRLRGGWRDSAPGQASLDRRSSQALTWITCAQDGFEHAVTEREMARCERLRHGVYPAVCSHRVIASALVAPAGQRCPQCSAEVRPAR